jgi:hypothetical protein
MNSSRIVNPFFPKAHRFTHQLCIQPNIYCEFCEYVHIKFSEAERVASCSVRQANLKLHIVGEAGRSTFEGLYRIVKGKRFGNQRLEVHLS